jgi:hypothetical protein
VVVGSLQVCVYGDDDDDDVDGHVDDKHVCLACSEEAVAILWLSAVYRCVW